MSAFDKIIGYDHIKAELMQISDMIHHPEVYAALDAKLPQGLLLSGAPGLGKTLMATALIGPLLILNPPLCKWLLRQMGAEDTLAFEDAAFASFNKRVAEFKEPGRGFQYS